MADQEPARREFAALESFLVEQAGYARYQRSQWAATRGRPGEAGGARPLEFDESGVAIAQSEPGIARRIARLLSPF